MYSLYLSRIRFFVAFIDEKKGWMLNPSFNLSVTSIELRDKAQIHFLYFRL